MKTLKMNLQQLGNVEVLTRSQMKNILGGLAEPGGAGTCQYETPTEFGTTWVDGVSKQDAQNNAGAVSGMHWCCDSCCSASWANHAGCAPTALD